LTGDLWVFGYGSLMWNPGFPHVEVRPALLRGYHRAFCIWSTNYRGTPERPGLVLGLDRGGSCRGVAFRVSATDVAAATDYLMRRELDGYVYHPRQLSVAIDGGPVTALTFVADRAADCYAGKLSPERIAEVIRRGVGNSGRNRDYLIDTLQHMDELGIPDRGLHRVLALVEGY
jgi:cation transport protein ChaC